MSKHNISSTSILESMANIQEPHQDSGLMALVKSAKILNIPATPNNIYFFHGKYEGAFESNDIIRCAQKIKIKAELIKIKNTHFTNFSIPFLVKRENIYYVVEELTNTEIKIYNPISNISTWLDKKSFEEQFESNAILLARNSLNYKTKSKYSFDWFIPSILKHLPRFKKVIAASILIQIFALASPKIFQVVIDTVLVSRSLQSLDVLAIALLAIAIFDPLMQYFRSTIFSHLASGVNSELSAKLYQHLISLPLSYFSNRKSGDIIARVRELDHIRNFLTGSALMLCVDLVFISVFLAFMFSYASDLAWIVLATLIIFLCIWLTIGPLLRKRITTQYETNASNTAYLTETVAGIETIKSLGISNNFIKRWNEHLALSLKANFRSNMLNHIGGGVIGLVQKISSAIILWFGVQLVLDSTLSVGELVAFNMLAGHVTMPILRLAQVWQDFQHTTVSIKRLGEILNESVELSLNSGKSSLEKISGEINFQKVLFRYDDGPEILKRIDLTIMPNEVIGITGSSGSGKSTITKLIQRFYEPQSGQVFLDGIDLAMVEPAILRKQIGVVLQDSFLFNGTIRDNIIMGHNNYSSIDIEQAVHLSGSSSFINELPLGLDSQVGENGSFLSGGQKQRIAIARALISDPKILIFDEATSALDYESESEILKRLPYICKDRTVIIIAHRLNVMHMCDNIIVMEDGSIIEKGSHSELISSDGRYSYLWNIQNKE